MPIPSLEELKEMIKKALEYAPKKNFKQSVELTIVLRDVDPRTPEGRIREVIFLPHKPKKDVKICVVADGEMLIKAKECGVHKVLSRGELQALASSKKAVKKLAQECDWFLVRTDLMALAGRILGPALGPRGKIPVPVPPNADIKTFVSKYESAVLVRTKDQAQLMCRIGTEDMSIDELAENAQAVISAIEPKLKNPSYNIAKVIIKTTMGPPIVYPERR